MPLFVSNVTGFPLMLTYNEMAVWSLIRNVGHYFAKSKKKNVPIFQPEMLPDALQTQPCLLSTFLDYSGFI